MSTRYFRVMATDNIPGFVPESQIQGSWYGTVATDDPEIIERLVAAKKVEFTEDEYLQKKSSSVQAQSQHLRHVPGSHAAGAKHVAPKVQRNAEVPSAPAVAIDGPNANPAPKRAPAVEIPTEESVISGVAIKPSALPTPKPASK